MTLEKPAKRAPRPPRPIARTSRLPRAGKLIARKTRPRKQRKTALAALKRKLWDRFAAYVKQRDGDTCFSCGRGGLQGTNHHAGHLFPAGSSSLIRYAPLNVHSQCYHDNINLGGAGAAYAERFIARYGIEQFQRLSVLSRLRKAWKAYEVEELIAALERGGADYELLYEERHVLPALALMASGAADPGVNVEQRRCA